MGGRNKSSCFIIMPFDKKQVGGELIDFDVIWRELICPAAWEAGFEPFRVDEDIGQAYINKSMINRIKDADVAVADVTYHNPNVYYELGMRHVLAKHGTILIKRTGGDMDVVERYENLPKAARDNTEIPFDLRSLAHFHFEMTQEKLAENRTKLANTIIARHNSIHSDSPVYEHLKDLRVTCGRNAAGGRQDRNYEIIDPETGQPSGKKIGYRSGDIANLTLESGKFAEYWVNSENTLMQMARIHERALSATIRYLGGRDPDTEICDDEKIPLLLKTARGNRHLVEKGHILTTDSGHLRETHGVKAILHAATVTGSPGAGFTPISEDATVDCVERVITKARNVIRGSLKEGGNPKFLGKTLIMPIFGAGQGGRDPSMLGGRIVWRAIETLLDAPSDLGEHDLDQVYFLAFMQDEVEMMRKIFEANVLDGDLKPVSSR